MLASWLHGFLSALCHQLPEHSLSVYGAPLPLCARCTGLYLAAAFTMLALAVRPATRRRAGLPTAPTIWMLALAACAWLADGLNSTVAFIWDAALYQPTNLLRLLTGIGMGLAVGLHLYPLLVATLAPTPDPQSVAARPAALLAPLLATAVGLAVVLMAPWATLRALLLALSALGTLATANGLLLAPLARRLGRRQLPLTFWLLGLGAALGEVALLLWAHRLLASPFAA